MTGGEFRALALALPGTAEAPHFDRRALRVRRIYATLAPDGLSANLALAPEEQEHYCTLWPEALAPVPNAWGRRGWTTATLARIGADEVAAPLRAGWLGAGGVD